MRSDIGSDQYRLVNLLEVVGEEVEETNNIDYDDHPYKCLSNWSCVTDVSSRFGPRYDKHGREIPELGSFHNSKLLLTNPIH